jgi:hypothetical protein
MLCRQAMINLQMKKCANMQMEKQYKTSGSYPENTMNNEFGRREI